MVNFETTPSPSSVMKDEETFGNNAEHTVDHTAPLGVEIHLDDISYKDQTILKDLSLPLKAGETTCLLGPSGVGKTSILKSVAGFLPLSGKSFVRASNNETLSGRISYMDQNDLLLPWASALENVLIGSRLSGTKPNQDKARQLLNLVGLKNNHQSRPHELSGGMKQRVALARTLMDECPIVLVDEPFSALDAITRHRLQSLFAKLLTGRTVLMITHDPLEALRIGHSAYILSGNPIQLSPELRIEGTAPRDATNAALKPRYDLIMSILGMSQEAEI